MFNEDMYYVTNHHNETEELDQIVYSCLFRTLHHSMCSQWTECESCILFRPNHKAATFACQSAPLMGFKFQLNSTKKAFKTPLSVIVRGDGNSLFLYTLKFEKQLQLGQFKQINNPLVLPTMHLSTHNASALAAITTE